MLTKEETFERLVGLGQSLSIDDFKETFPEICQVIEEIYSWDTDKSKLVNGEKYVVKMESGDLCIYTYFPESDWTGIKEWRRII